MNNETIPNLNFESQKIEEMSPTDLFTTVKMRKNVVGL